MFISDPSDIWWDKQIFANPEQIKLYPPSVGVSYKNPFIPDGELYPVDEFTTRYTYTYPLRPGN
jgi:hypothetical protein